MAAVAVTTSNTGRSGVFITPSVIPITLTASSTTYTSASGGLPFDLFAVLQQAAPLELGSLNYKDIVDFVGTSTTGHMANTFAVGTVTSTTCPCTIKLWNGTTELSDGATSVTVKGFLFVNRNGAN